MPSARAARLSLPFIAPVHVDGRTRSLSPAGLALDPRVPIAAKGMANVLGTFMNERTGSCTLLIDTLAAAACLKRSATKALLRELKRSGWLGIESRHDGSGRQVSSTYRWRDAVTGEPMVVPPPQQLSFPRTTISLVSGVAPTRRGGRGRNTDPRGSEKRPGVGSVNRPHNDCFTDNDLDRRAITTEPPPPSGQLFLPGEDPDAVDWRAIMRGTERANGLPKEPAPIASPCPRALAGAPTTAPET